MHAPASAVHKQNKMAKRLGNSPGISYCQSAYGLLQGTPIPVPVRESDVLTGHSHTLLIGLPQENRDWNVKQPQEQRQYSNVHLTKAVASHSQTTRTSRPCLFYDC